MTNESIPHRETDIPVCSGPQDIPVCSGPQDIPVRSGPQDIPVRSRPQAGMPVPPLQMPVPRSATHVYHRNLPHWRRDGAIYWITFRLADALPQSKLVQLRAEKEIWIADNPEPW